MKFESRISLEEREYLRELSKKQLEYANLPIMKEREKFWFAHNRLNGSRPMIVMEEITFWDDVRENPKCRGALAIEIENQLKQNIAIVELLGDDKVVPDFYKMELYFDYKKFGIEQTREYAEGSIGYHIEPVLIDLRTDLEKLKPSKYYLNKEYYDKKKNFIEDNIGDILPVKTVNGNNYWDMALSEHVVKLMGTENMFCAMLDTPDEFHNLMSFLTKDTIRFLRWQEEHRFIFLNNGNDYMGSGSFCFTEELPQKDFKGTVRSIDTWGHLNSQESVGISPSMFQEFILPYMKEIAGQFGLLYYGCCEPASDFWKNGIEELPNLRKVSISAWCNEKMMADELAGKDIIYSRKPSPNYLGIQEAFDEEAFRKHIRATVELTKKCKTEFIFRDIYKLHGNIKKIRRAVEITREETEK